ncbi:hypothetical protein V1520DRAFT_79054 [Lipomyces starkeyi]|uniref:Uncharacterized protein n=1 Tax=Lipomyces starkeyi NRRL Y-11557 TaxID=675824 RepID=A0A1E3QC23_LIPST|nr:hypothetical protein LIPSTDRAFT_103262 [Lipomyces starkeyi NRRL Y-11557]
MKATGCLYKVNNSNIEGYKQYLFYEGRFGAENLRKIIQRKTALSTTLYTVVAVVDQHAGHSNAVSSFMEPPVQALKKMLQTAQLRTARNSGVIGQASQRATQG